MKNLEIPKASVAATNKMLATFQMMDFVAQSQEEFDPREHFNETDEFYKPMMRYYDPQENEFDYKLFLQESINTIGTGFQNVLIGYSSMVEKFCDPDSNILQGNGKVVSLQENEFIAKGKLIEIYETVEEFDRSVMKWISKYGHNAKILTFNASGYLTTGYEMTKLPKGEFPVKAYLLQRSAEFPLPYKSNSNN